MNFGEITIWHLRFTNRLVEKSRTKINSIFCWKILMSNFSWMLFEKLDWKQRDWKSTQNHFFTLKMQSRIFTTQHPKKFETISKNSNQVEKSWKIRIIHLIQKIFVNGVKNMEEQKFNTHTKQKNVF